MDFVQNFPFFSIILSMFSGTVSSVLPAKAAKWLNTVVIGAVGCMSAVLLVYLMGKGTSYTYMMGHFPAPWGNEIRAGVLEAGMALFFCIIMLLSLMGGRKKLLGEVEYSKHNLYGPCIYQRPVHRLCICGNQYHIRLRPDHDQAERKDD